MGFVDVIWNPIRNCLSLLCWRIIFVKIELILGLKIDSENTHKKSTSLPTCHSFFYQDIKIFLLECWVKISMQNRYLFLDTVVKNSITQQTLTYIHTWRVMTIKANKNAVLTGTLLAATWHFLFSLLPLFFIVHEKIWPLYCVNNNDQILHMQVGH